MLAQDRFDFTDLQGLPIKDFCMLYDVMSYPSVLAQDRFDFTDLQRLPIKDFCMLYGQVHETWVYDASIGIVRINT